MYKVAKQMVKMKDSLINQKIQAAPGPGMERSHTMKPAQARPDAMSPPRERTMKNTSTGLQKVGQGADEGNPFGQT